jgi:hypothetical protein
MTSVKWKLFYGLGARVTVVNAIVLANLGRWDGMTGLFGLSALRLFFANLR